MKKTWIWVFSLAVIALLIVLAITESTKQNEIEIGAILPLTGQSAQYGKWIQQALELGRKQINESGGINGKKLVIAYEDDQADPTMAANAMWKLEIKIMFRLCSALGPHPQYSLRPR